jgi:hypothetical protein
MRAQHNDIAIINGAVNGRNFISLTGRAGNGASGGAFDFFIITGMVIMVMSVPNLRQRPAGFVQRRHNGRGFWRVDTGGFAALAIMHKKAVIIAQAWELVNF